MGLEAQDPKYQPGHPQGPDGQPDDVIISADTRRDERIPPGQSRTRKWPVLHATTVPHVTRDSWSLEIRGLVRNPLRFNWDELQALPRVKVFSDFHCVTQWSRLGNLWEGVSIHEVLNRAEVLPEAKFAVIEGFDGGWTTNLPLADLLSEDVLICDTHDGEPIDADHGGPVRLVVPLLYAWKSAKWLKAIELVDRDQPGYWERGGYHLLGDPWKEQRYRDDPAWLRR